MNCENCGDVWAEAVTMLRGIPARLCVRCRRAYDRAVCKSESYRRYVTALVEVRTQEIAVMGGRCDIDSVAELRQAEAEMAASEAALSDFACSWLPEPSERDAGDGESPERS